MPHKKTYSMKVGAKLDISKISSFVSGEPVLILDNLSSSFTLDKIRYPEGELISKEIVSVQDIGNGSLIKSNTTDLLLTDISLENGIPLYYKTEIVVDSFSKIEIEETNNFMHDDYFIYSDSKDMTISYLSNRNEIISIRKQEVLPIFIWDNMVNLINIFEKDNKTYSFIKKDSHIYITTSKKILYYEVDNYPVYNLSRKGNHFSLSPFIFNRLIRDEDGEVSFTYDYSSIFPNIVSRKMKRIVVTNNKEARLEELNVLKESITIVKYENGILVEVFNNGDELKNNIIDSTNGIVDLYEVQNIGLDESYYANFKHLVVNSNRVCLTNATVDLINKDILFSINPTSIKSTIGELSYPPRLTYTVVDKAGNIVIDKITKSGRIINIPVYLGYGEGGFGENGYSGITEEKQDVSIDSSILRDYETGWSYGAFGEGPFGGTFLGNSLELDKLYSAKNNTDSGNLLVSILDTNIKINDYYAIESLGEAKMQLYPYMNLKSYSGVVLLLSMKESSQEIAAIATQIIRDAPRILFKAEVIKITNDQTIVKFDMSELTDILLADGSMDPSLVIDMSIQKNIDIINSVSSSMNEIGSSIFSINDLKLFTMIDGNMEEVFSEIYLSVEDGCATAIIDNEINNIGMGYVINDNILYPGEMLRI